MIHLATWNIYEDGSVVEVRGDAAESMDFDTDNRLIQDMKQEYVGQCAELRPPAEHADKDYHWLLDVPTNTPEPWEWCEGAWFAHGTDAPMSAPEFAEYRYLGPAEWRGFDTALKVAADQLDIYAARITELEAETAALLAARDEFHARWVRGDSIVNPPLLDGGALGMAPPTHAAPLPARALHTAPGTIPMLCLGGAPKIPTPAPAPPAAAPPTIANPAIAPLERFRQSLASLPEPAAPATHAALFPRRAMR